MEVFSQFRLFTIQREVIFAISDHLAGFIASA